MPFSLCSRLPRIFSLVLFCSKARQLGLNSIAWSLVACQNGNSLLFPVHSAIKRLVLALFTQQMPTEALFLAPIAERPLLPTTTEPLVKRLAQRRQFQLRSIYRHENGATWRNVGPIGWWHGSIRFHSLPLHPLQLKCVLARILADASQPSWRFDVFCLLIASSSLTGCICVDGAADAVHFAHTQWGTLLK